MVVSATILTIKNNVSTLRLYDGINMPENYYYYHEIVQRVHKNNTKIKKLKKVKKAKNNNNIAFMCNYSPQLGNKW